MSVAVRPLDPADRAAWGDVWAGYLAFYGADVPGVQFDLHFARLVDPVQSHWHGLVANGPQGPVGIAHVLLHPHGWQARDTAYLQDLFVVPAARGTGVGRALIEAAYDLADRLEAQGVYWTTQHFNTDARALYDKVGRLTPFIKYTRP